MKDDPLKLYCEKHRKFFMRFECKYGSRSYGYSHGCPACIADLKAAIAPRDTGWQKTWDYIQRRAATCH